MRVPTIPPVLSKPRSPDEHVEAWRQRGVSARIYAEEHGLTASTLYGWRRALRRRGARASQAQRILPVVVTATSCCEVVLADGRTLRFPDTLAPATLRAFLGAMERA